MSREVVVELLKYPGRPNRIAATKWVGEDEYGTWLAADRTLHLVPHEGWWTARHFPDGGWKIDITTPATWEGNRVVLEDLALDVRKYHWQTWIEDEDQFTAAVASNLYPPEVARAARVTADDLLGKLYCEPFLHVGDSWLAQVPSRFVSAIILDMGGVLARAGDGTARAGWEGRLGLEHGGLARAFRKAIGPGWEGGRSTEEISWILRTELGVNYAQLWQLRLDLISDSWLDETLLELLSSRSASAAAAVVSNNGADVRPLWEAAFDINAFVDLLVISGEERVAKPDPRIYEIACGRLGVAAERCVFVDDDEANVEAARALGMSAVHHSESSPAYSEIADAASSLGGR